MSSLKIVGIRWCVLLEAICVVLITFFTMIGAYSLVSITFNASFIILLIACFQRIRNVKINKKLLILSFVSIIVVVINSLIEGNGIGNFEYYKKLIMLLTSIIFYYYSLNIRLSKNTIKKIKLCMFITSAMLPFSFYIVGNKMTLGNLITINYTNPNFAGMWLLTSIIALIYLFFSTSKIFKKIIIGTVATINIYLLTINNTRSCLISLMFFLFLIILGYIRKKYYFSKIFIFCMLLIPLIFAIIYIQLIDKVSFISEFDFMISEGKSITSRLDVWEHAINIIKNNLLMGNYWAVSGGTGQAQCHNTALDIIASYGVIVYSLYITVLFKYTSWLSNNQNWHVFVAVIGFIAIYITGCFEAALVAGSMGLSIFVSMLLVVGIHDYQEVKND